MTKRTRWALFAGVALVVVGAIVVRDSGGAMEVSTARIVRDTLHATVREEGKTRLRDRYVVASPVTGRLARITLVEGDTVRAGAAVAQIFAMPSDPRSIGVQRAQLGAVEARRNSARAVADEASARLQQMELDLERSVALAAAGAISEAALEQVRLATISARQQVEAAKASVVALDAEVEAARLALLDSDAGAAGTEPLVVRAPAAGRVLRIAERSGRVVQAGTPLLEIGETSGIELVVDVLSADAVQIPVGARVFIDQWGGDSTLEGRVRIVEPDAFTEVSALGVQEQRVQVVVDLVNPPPALGAGFRVEASIVTWTGTDAVVVPTSALFQQEGGWFVFVVREDRAVLQSVTIGHRSAENAEVLGGLAEGDTVVVFPSAEIRDGVRLRPRA